MWIVIVITFLYILSGGFKKRSENIWFYKIGIGGKNSAPPQSKWKIQTLGTIMSDNNERNVSNLTRF